MRGRIMSEKDRKAALRYLLWIAALLMGISAIFPCSRPVFADVGDAASVALVRSGAEIDNPPFSLVDE